MKKSTTVMQTYEIEICETSAMVVPVTAESLDAAIDRVKEAYNREEIVLDTDNFQDITFRQV